MDAGERGLGLPVGLIDRSATRAGPARVARVDCDHGNASQLRLVGDELAELRECPPVHTVALALSGPNPLADVRQVFDGNCKAVAFSRSSDLLRDAVARVLSEPGLLPGEFLEAPLGRLGASGLEPGTTLGELLPDALDLCARVGSALAIESDVDDAEVDAEHAIDIDLARVGHVADNRQEPLAPDEHQVYFAFAEGKQLSLTLAADEWDNFSTIERPDTHSIGHQPEDAIVIGLRRVLAELDQLRIAPVGFMRRVGVSDLGDAADGDLSRNLELSPSSRVPDLMQVELADFAGLEAGHGEEVACLVTTLKRAPEQVSLRLRGLELDVGHQFHSSSIEQSVNTVNPGTSGRARFPLPAKDRQSPAREN